ncbi:hypothetical protein E1176_16005 [Fulvivirga sp. RKSG066]|uniref:hypothetical protein n=1 Tax=Fulvivirga aurantia TaxID=2529383 RepID=UPI0012BBB7C6|nr:hypothetical protein [Fulvivirga aurantia]MTI22536.1 hypothetical protein [Fulvivirga aurantia]
MFSENEIATIIEIPEVHVATVEVKADFIANEANFLEISDHDFLSLVMMAPTVGMALANGSISLFEELALNKMARKMSKGGFFMKVDPVAHGMKFLIKNFEAWEMKFYEVIKISMEHTFSLEDLKKEKDHSKGFAYAVMNVPYMFVRFLSSFFLHDDSDIVDERAISEVEFKKIQDIGHKLGLDEYPIFKSFCQTFEMK